jgi:hypothetical protein
MPLDASHYLLLLCACDCFFDLVHHLLAVAGIWLHDWKKAGESTAYFLCFPNSLEVICRHATVADFASGGLHQALLLCPAIYV